MEESLKEKYLASFEAILFAMGEPVEEGRIASALGLGAATIRDLAKDLAESYEEKRRGIRLITINGSYQLCTKKELYDVLIKIAVQPKKPTLTDVLLETLSIIAYKQPVTKVEIEKIRGVKSDHAVNKLVEWGLVKELGRLDAPGKPILLGTTEEFLRSFGVEDLTQLPVIDPEKLENLKKEAESEAAKMET